MKIIIGFPTLTNPDDGDMYIDIEAIAAITPINKPGSGGYTCVGSVIHLHNGSELSTSEWPIAVLDLMIKADANARIVE